MSYLNNNLRNLRKQNDLTQVELANILHLKRASIGSYEEDRSEPRLDTLKRICNYFNISLDDLINTDLSRVSASEFKISTNEKLRILTIVVDKNDKEMITLVPIKAAAGYLDGYGDLEFIEELPKFQLPFPEISSGRTYRAFEIIGDSMLPITSGSYILCEYVEDIETLKSDICYILVTTEDGIVYKRVINNLAQNQQFLLKSDNENFDSFHVKANDVKEAWKAVGYLSFNIPEENHISINELSEIVRTLQSQVKNIKLNE